MFIGMNAIDFNRRFKTNEDCYRYLMDFKWAKGFSCSRCGSHRYTKGRQYFHKRCRSCRYDESVLARTIFHGMKMPILKAFHMVFRISAKKKGMSTVELGCEVGVQQKTAWLFKRKMQAAMRQSGDRCLKNQADIDFALIALGFQNRLPHHDPAERKAFLISEMPNEGSVTITELANYSGIRLTSGLRVSVVPGIEYPKVCYTLSSDGLMGAIQRNGVPEPFQNLQTLRAPFTNWLAGIHHRWSKEHFGCYTDEYHFRLNRRCRRKFIFNDLVRHLVNQKPHPYPVIRELCGYST